MTNEELMAENERLKKMVLQRLAPHAVATWRERLAFEMMRNGWYEAAALVRESSESLDKDAREADYARQRLGEVEAENERLREALKPFAAVASWPDVLDGVASAPLPDRYALTWAVVTEGEAIGGGPVPTVGDCRRAAELLKEVGQ